MPEKELKVYCETSFWSFLNGRPTPVQHVAVNMFDDPMDEIYAMRHKVAEKYDYSLDRIFEAAAARQRENEAKGMVYIRLPIARRTSMP